MLDFKKDLSNYKNRESKVKSRMAKEELKTQEERDLEVFLFNEKRARH